ncbi:hypothetical protein, partial [Klebsiella quasipneumoniae]|uniref:hypothetical protein n=1 Tax=Klebsiella quasipneumoniae TaxID=1463165 RepID=UPI003EE5EE13
PQNDVTLKMPAFEWVHVQLHQQKGMISLSPPTICNSASVTTLPYTISERFSYIHSEHCRAKPITTFMLSGKSIRHHNFLVI